MKDEKIAKLIADKLFFPSAWDSKEDTAVRAFIERVAIPEDVESFSYEDLESYIRDALKRGTDHWDFCSPDEIPGTDSGFFRDLENLTIRGDSETHQ